MGGGNGNGASAGLAPDQLEAELRQLAGRDWGKLPGHLRTEILDAARRRPHGEYAKLIKLYFKEIAKAGAETTPAGGGE